MQQGKASLKQHESGSMGARAGALSLAAAAARGKFTWRTFEAAAAV